jgi:uncharacterized repeat protein (TIGR01451 family)
MARAAELPTASHPVYLQTVGRMVSSNYGDWYTSIYPGGFGYHYLTIEVPCGWPANKPIDIDLFSPEMNSTGARADEIIESGNSTIFELYAPGTAFVPPATPAARTGIPGTEITYSPSSAPQQWVRYHTLTAPTCGRYLLRASTQGDDRNAWKIQVGDDDDANPNNALPSRYDDADGVSGTGDELVIGIFQSTFQQGADASTLDLYEYVSPGQTSITYHNFDLAESGLGSVQYHSPGGLEHAGTTSSNNAWNGGTASSRGGDTLANPEPGWWRVVTTADGRMNRYIMEGQTLEPAYYQQPPTPAISMSISDGVAEVKADDVVTYTIEFTNTSADTEAPGAAANLTIQNTIPDDTSYLSCDANGLGTCWFDSGTGTVTFTLAEMLVAGEGGALFVTAQLHDAAVSGEQAVSRATLDYEDAYGRAFTPLTATNANVVTPSTPLGIQLASFTAIPADHHILVTWETASELGNQGFNLYRSTDPATPGTQLNETFIPSEAAGSIEGFAYQWQDTAIEAGATYHYWLESVDSYGHATRYGPVSATLATPTAVALNAFSAEPRWSGSGVAIALAALTALGGACVDWQRRRRA